MRNIFPQVATKYYEESFTSMNDGSGLSRKNPARISFHTYVRVWRGSWYEVEVNDDYALQPESGPDEILKCYSRFIEKVYLVQQLWKLGEVDGLRVRHSKTELSEADRTLVRHLIRTNDLNNSI
jgi:hypothetical protein